MNAIIKYLTSFRLLYIIIGGFCIYLLSASIDLIFIPTLELSEGWCKELVEKKIIYRQVKECVKFSSNIEALKYKHNQSMEKRSSYKMFAFFFSASVFTYFLMWLNPANFFDKKTEFDHNAGALATAVYYGVILGFLMPIIYQELLPPAHEWFPREFIEIRKARVGQILNEIKEVSKYISQDGMAPE
jgi:hypothetical protein